VVTAAKLVEAFYSYALISTLAPKTIFGPPCMTVLNSRLTHGRQLFHFYPRVSYHACYCFSYCGPSILVFCVETDLIWNYDLDLDK